MSRVVLVDLVHLTQHLHPPYLVLLDFLLLFSLILDPLDYSVVAVAVLQ
jgi:hypothetical protein